MKKIILIFSLILCSCTTPKTILKNEQTGQVTICGGSIIGAMTGGIIGYHIQKSNDSECVNDYTGLGFHPIYQEDLSK